MTRAAVASLLLVALAAGCSGSRSSGEAPETAATTTVPPASGQQTTTAAAPAPRASTFRVYLVRDERVYPVGRSSAATPAVGRAAVLALLAGPTGAERDAGLSSALPADDRMLGLTIADGVATVKLSGDLDSLGRAQLVYTLTQFPTVRTVRIGEAPPAARSTYEDETPIILVESPLPGATVTSPLRFTGTANTFEATFQADVVSASGKLLATKFATASSGSGQRGTFDETISFGDATGPGRLVVYELSANDGSRTHQSEIPVELG